MRGLEKRKKRKKERKKEKKERKATTKVPPSFFPFA